APAPPTPPPSPYTTLFRSDDLGRDLLSRVIHGTGLALTEGIAVALIANLIAIPVGLLVVEVPRTDSWVMRVNDALLAFPGLLLRSEEHTSELQSRENLVCR